MTQDELVARVAAATCHETAAREAHKKASAEAEAAAVELRKAWTELRDHQDELVRRELGLAAIPGAR